MAGRLLLCLSLLPCGLTSVVPCFWWTGEPAIYEGTYSFPCDPLATVSACCWTGQICLSNFQCAQANQPNNTWFGSCTDSTGKNPVCPCPGGSKCSPMNLILAFLNAITNKIELSDPPIWTDCSDGTRCCGGDNYTCCEKGQGKPVVVYSSIFVIPTYTTPPPLSSYPSETAPNSLYKGIISSTAVIGSSSELTAVSLTRFSCELLL